MGTREGMGYQSKRLLPVTDGGDQFGLNNRWVPGAYRWSRASRWRKRKSPEYRRCLSSIARDALFGFYNRLQPRMGFVERSWKGATCENSLISRHLQAVLL